MKTGTQSLVGIALTALLAAGSASAQSSARAFLKKRHDSVISILRRPAADAPAIKSRNAELDRLLGTLLDYDELSRRTLPGQWEGLNESQKAEFSSLLKRLVQKSYRKNLESTLDYSILYTGETKGSEGVVVHTKARSRKNRRAPEILIDYTLKKTGSSWLVLDVITDGVSLTQNYKSQFNRIIRRHGWDALLQRMRKRLESGSGNL